MTTPYKTPAQLATSVMRRLGLIDANKQPTAAEQAIIIDHYYDKFEELAADDLVYWPVAQIPRAAFGAIVRIVAEEFATTMGKDIPTEQIEGGRAVTIGNRGMHMLRKHLSRPTTGLPTQTNYF